MLYKRIDAASNVRQALLRGNRESNAGRHEPAGRAQQRGKAVQVDPIKPTLKAPGTKRLKLKYDKLLSSFAFDFNLRRYNVTFDFSVKTHWQPIESQRLQLWASRFGKSEAGAYTRPLFGST